MLKVYSKALDYILQSVVAASEGKGEKSAKYLARAMEEQDFQQTMDGLNDQQDQLLDQQDDDFGVDLDDQGFDDQQQQSFSRALARVAANKRKVTAADDDQDSDDDDKEEQAGSGHFDNEGSDAESVKIEHASAEDSEDDSSDDKPAFLKDKDESSVMANASARLARASRAKANLAMLENKSKSKK